MKSMWKYPPLKYIITRERFLPLTNDGKSKNRSKNSNGCGHLWPGDNLNETIFESSECSTTVYLNQMYPKVQIWYQCKLTRMMRSVTMKITTFTISTHRTNLKRKMRSSYRKGNNNQKANSHHKSDIVF